MKMSLKKNKMINLMKFQKKKLEEMNHAHVIQERNINTVMELYDKIKIIDAIKIIAKEM